MYEDKKLFDLGWALCRAHKGNVVIVVPSDSSEGCFEPAQSLTLCRTQDIETLKAACEFALLSTEKPK